MKCFYSSVVVTLAGLLVTCSAAPSVTLVGDELDFALKYGYIQGVKQIKERTTKSPCQKNEVYHILKTLPRKVEASAFCSSYIRPKPTVTSTSTNTIVLTETTTQTETELTTTIATATVATVTELCATPTAPVTCGFEALGFGQFFISQTPGLSGLACHRLCLVTAGCAAFETQNGGQGFCNLFNAPTAGNVQATPGGGFTFYDRDCTDLLPAGCALPPAKFKRTALFPPGIAGKLKSQISAACTCLITSAPPATSTFTVVVPTSTVTTTTDVIITTKTIVQTDSTDVTYVTYTTV